jgi:hypothetical protein
VGYYKEQEIANDVDRLVSWYAAHCELIPTYVMARILGDQKLLDDLMAEWETGDVAPPAKRGYTVLQRPAPIKTRRETYRKPKFELTTVMAIAIVISVWALAVIGAVLIRGL